MEHQITPEQARALTHRYRENRNSMMADGFKDALPFCESFNADSVRSLLAQPGCTGFRAYLGMQPDQRVCMIFTATDAAGKDIISIAPGQENGIVLEDGKWCPPNCPADPL
jgi:hypothetical protein